jgi:hypothetical protein
VIRDDLLDQEQSVLDLIDQEMAHAVVVQPARQEMAQEEVVLLVRQEMAHEDRRMSESLQRGHPQHLDAVENQVVQDLVRRDGARLVELLESKAVSPKRTTSQRRLDVKSSTTWKHQSWVVFHYHAATVKLLECVEDHH